MCASTAASARLSLPSISLTARAGAEAYWVWVMSCGAGHGDTSRSGHTCSAERLSRVVHVRTPVNRASSAAVSTASARERNGPTASSNFVERTAVPDCGPRTAVPDCGARTAVPDCGARTAVPDCGARTAVPDCGARTAVPDCGARTAENRGNASSVRTTHHQRCGNFERRLYGGACAA